MADPVIQSSPKSRLIRRGLITCGWGIVAVMVYVASIGPLALLQSQGFGSDKTWEYLKDTIYHPIYSAWWHGPKWLDRSLRCYVGCFELTDSESKSFGAVWNHWGYRYAVRKRAWDRRDQEQLEWDKAHPEQAKAREEWEEGQRQQGATWCVGDPNFTKAEIAEAERNWWQSIFR